MSEMTAPPGAARAAGWSERAAAGFETSLWSRTSTSAPRLAALGGSPEVEVAIIGAGYTGLTAAIEMAGRGADVIVLDAREPGFGASGRNGGQVVPAFKRSPESLIADLGEEVGRGVIDMVVRSADLVFELIARHGIDCDAVQTGWIQGARSRVSEETLRQRSDAWQRQGAGIRWLDAAAVAALSGSDWFRAGWMLSRGGSVHPLKYARGLALAAIRMGARVFRDSPATRLDRVGDRWLVTTPGGQLRAKRVVLATNGYTTALWPGLRESVVPVYSMQVASDPLPERVGAPILPEGQTMTDARHLVHYFRRDAQGRLIIGSRGPFRHDVAARDVDGLIAMARRFYPQLADVQFPFRWAGRVAMTADSLPHLHRLAPGLTAALGYNGRGVALACAMGRALAAAALDERGAGFGYPVTPLTPLPFHRFSRLGVQMMIWYYRVADRVA